MGRRTIAPRLRLLGLLLICASIIMGLLLSAAGVQSVNLSSPFAQGIAERWQNVSNTPSSNSNANQPQGDNIPSGFYDSEVLPIGMENPYPNGNPAPGSINDLGGLATRSPLISTNRADSNRQNEPFTISLWALVTPICLVGILLWMTPMPSASTTNRSSRRR